MSIEKNSIKILSFLYNDSTKHNDSYIKGKTLQDLTSLSTEEINNAVELLKNNGYIETNYYLGTTPFTFGDVKITPLGIFKYEKMKEEDNKDIEKSKIPRGSPFGFEKEDWEIVYKRKNDKNTIYIVFGYQFESKFYDAKLLTKNVEKLFKTVINLYNKNEDTDTIKIKFIPLKAGFGEHLFNKIACDIISSDIAIFEISNKNPNVMIEMGVALTWGSKVIPMLKKRCKTPPSDISGQTYLRYNNNGEIFYDDDINTSIYECIDKAVKRKKR